MEIRQQHHQSHHQPSLVATASTTTQRTVVSSGLVFRWTANVTVLFEGWTTRTIAGLTTAMLLAAFAGAMYELLRNFLSSWDSTPRPLCSLPRWKIYTLRIFRSGMHLLNAAAGYTQMLLAMTFDLRIFTAILIGSSLGFFVLGPYFSRITFKRKSQYEQTAIVSSVEQSSEVKDRRHNLSDLRPDNKVKKCSAEERDLEKSVPLLTLDTHDVTALTSDQEFEQINYKELSQLEETAV